MATTTGALSAPAQEIMTESHNTLPSDRIRQSILLIRGQRVMLVVDLALVYGVTTKRLNEQVTRNQDRFPADFMFRLARQEKMEVVANCDHLGGLKFSAAPPRAFTEHGTIMLAAVLSSPVAIHASVQIVRAFAQLREMLSGHRDLADKLAVLERQYDQQFKVVFDAIRELIIRSRPRKRRSASRSPIARRTPGRSHRECDRWFERTKRPHSQAAAGPSFAELAPRAGRFANNPIRSRAPVRRIEPTGRA